MIDLHNALSTSADISVQAHWDPIENTANNLPWATEEKFNRFKAQWQEPVDLTWKQWLKLFNPGPAQPLKKLQHNGFPSLSPAISRERRRSLGLGSGADSPLSPPVSSRGNNECRL